MNARVLAVAALVAFAGCSGGGDGGGGTGPTPVFTSLTIAPTSPSVTVGGLHACGLKVDGSAWCWGWNIYGQLGDGSTTDRTIPTQVGSDTDWATITTGGGSTCGVKTDDTVFG